MLKGKKGIYILIPVNLLVWGFFVYRFYSAYNETDEPVSDRLTRGVKLDDIKDSVNYKLKLAYDDPFLKKEVRTKFEKLISNGSQKPLPKIEKQKKVKEEPVKPDIKYLGLVKNNNSGSITAIVSINGSSKLIKQDETIDGLCFKNFTSENLTVLWNKEKIVITK